MRKIHEPKIAEVTRNVNGQSYHYWQITYYETGKRIRRMYTTKQDAEQALTVLQRKALQNVELQKVLSGRIGRKARKLSDDILLDAASAMDILKGTVTLTNCAKYYLRHHRPDDSTTTVNAMFNGCYSQMEQAKLRPPSLAAFKHRCKAFLVAYGERRANTITVEDITAHLKTFEMKSLTTLKGVAVAIGTLFNYGMEQEIVASNPATAWKAKNKRVLKAIQDQKLPECLSVSDVERVMAAAEMMATECAAMLAIGFFAGLRTSELHGLTWQNIDLAEGFIRVLPETAKKRRTRNVKIHPNLAAWLAAYRKDAGPVGPLDGQDWRHRRDAILKTAKIARWPNNAMRHSFATYHMAQFHDAKETAWELGHRDVQLIDQHYKTPGISAEDAAKFWAIRPKTESNVVAINRGA